MTERPDIAAIRARLANATPGPWESREHKKQWHVTSVETEEHVALISHWTNDVDEADADLIANAPTDLAALIEEVERLRGLLREVSAATYHSDEGTSGYYLPPHWQERIAAELEGDK